MELVLRNTGNERLDGKKIWLEYDPSDASWECSSEIDDKYLPTNLPRITNCRRHALTSAIDPWGKPDVRTRY